MRDRSVWQAGLVAELRQHLEDERKPHIAASRLCEVELGLYLMEQLIPGHPAEAGWTLMGGYPFARAIGSISSPGQEQMLRIARHLLWPLRRPRSWALALERYTRFDERLRGYLLDGPGHVAQRRDPAIAHERWEIYAAALATPPPFLTKDVPVAGAGPYRFLEHRRGSGGELVWSGVELPADLPQQPGAEHELGTPMAGGGKPLQVRWDELADTAVWMDTELAARNEPSGQWADRFSRVRLAVRDSAGSDYAESDVLTIDRMLHIVGMVGAGKSTVRDVLAVWAAHRGLRSTLVVGDVAEALHLVDLFTALGIAAAAVLGASTRERHIQRMHRRLATQGHASLLAQYSPAFDYLSTACPLDALRGVEAAEPLLFSDAPCAYLRPAGRRAPARRLSALAAPQDDELAANPAGKRHSCPLWHQCPRHHGARELVAADIWIATPASLVHSSVPVQQNPERLRYLELACRRSDLIVVDEADRVQMQLDIMFAPATTLVGKAPNSWLDEVHTHKIEELSRSGRIQLSDADVMRWTAAVHSVSVATDRIYAILLRQNDVRRWVEVDYFSAWTLQQNLIDSWFGTEGDREQADAADLLDRPGPEWDDAEHGSEDQSPANPTDPDRSADPHDDEQCATTIQILDEFRDDPLGDIEQHREEVQALIRLTRQLLHTTRTRSTRRLVREQLQALSGQPDPAATANPTRKAQTEAKRKIEEQTRQFEFTLLLAVLHTRLDMMTEMWPRVEAALNLAASSNVLSRRPPEDYRPLVPESPMGNILGFQFQSDDSGTGEAQTGELRFFRCAGAGREVLLGLTSLTAADGLPSPHVVLMSGTSWAGTSTRYHVLTEVSAILKPPQDEVDAIAGTTFTTCFLKGTGGKPLKLSGTKPQLRPLMLEKMLSQLARPRPDGSPSPLQAELAAISDDKRRRLLVLTGSYDEARRAADYLETIERWAGKVCRLVSDDAEQDHLWRLAAQVAMPARGGPARVLRRGDVATFAETGAEILVAPLLAIERGHNILNDEGTAAIGSVFFLARPHPRPDDIGLAIQAVNDWAARMLRDGSFDELVRSQPTLDAAGKQFRHLARVKWHRLLNRELAWSRLSPEEKVSFTWDQLVVIWQVIGRLVRGGVPARVVFVDAPFAERQAQGLGGDTARTSLLVSMLHVLAPYCGDRADAEVPGCGEPAPALDRVLVTALYEPLYGALSRLFPNS